MTASATSNRQDPDADIDDLWGQLHRSGILNDARKHAEPYKAFVSAYNM